MIARLALAALLLAGCAEPGLAPGSASPSGAAATSSAAPGTDAPGAPASATPLPLPAGFPVHESMDQVAADGGYVAVWASDALPSQVYDFYVGELAAAGFVIDLEGPGGEAAIIRFTSPDGIAYQLDLTGRGPAEITLGAPHD